MKQRVIIDTGLLVAFINRREHLHTWVINTLATIEQPLLTCKSLLNCDASLERLHEL